MDKIEYKITQGGKSVKKEISLVELDWSAFCKTADLRIKLENPNGQQFTNVAQLIQVYTVKSDQEMLDWKSGCEDQVAFMNEVASVMNDITDHINSKKK